MKPSSPSAEELANRKKLGANLQNAKDMQALESKIKSIRIAINIPIESERAYLSALGTLREREKEGMVNV